MRKRVNREEYDHVDIDPSWDEFENFLRDMGKKPSPLHTLDRIDNDKGYGPENCRWATRSEQTWNRRVCIKLVVDGVEHNLLEWSNISGIRHRVIYKRLGYGWDPRDAIFCPVRKRWDNV